MKTNTTVSVLCAALFFITSCSTITTPRPSASKNMPSEGVTLSDFKLTGDLGGDVAAFTLTANAMVGDAKGRLAGVAFRPRRAHQLRPEAEMGDDH